MPERDTQLSVLDLGDLVVTPEVLERVAWEKRITPQLAALPSKHKKLLTALLKLNADYAQLWFSQVKLAEKLKMGISTVKRALKRFKELGLIAWVFRGIKKTCEYTFSKFLNSKSVRDKLACLVSGFKYIPMTFLLSSNASLFALKPVRQNVHLVASGLQGTNVENIISNSLSLKAFILMRSEKRVIESLSVCNTARARVRENAPLSLFLIKNQEKEMKTFSQSLAITAASQVKSIKLTSYGRLIVSSYPAEAIRFADAEMSKKNMAKVQKPVGLFTAICKQYCEKNAVRPDFSRLTEFKNNNPEWTQLVEFEPTTQATSSYPKAQVYTQERDPLAFDRVGEWTNFVLKGKEILAQGGTVNPFWKEEIDKYDAALTQGADLTDIPVQSLSSIAGVPVEIIPIQQVSVPYLPLDAEDEELINEILRKKNLIPDKDTRDLLVASIEEVRLQGADHIRVKDGSFKAGLQHLQGVLKECQGVEQAFVCTTTSVEHYPVNHNVVFLDEAPRMDYGLFVDVY